MRVVCFINTSSARLKLAAVMTMFGRGLSFLSSSGKSQTATKLIPPTTAVLCGSYKHLYSSTRDFYLSNNSQNARNSHCKLMRSSSSFVYCSRMYSSSPGTNTSSGGEGSSGESETPNRESFEVSNQRKKDKRFDSKPKRKNKCIPVTNDDNDDESARLLSLYQTILNHHKELRALDPSIIRRATTVLEGYLTQDRRSKMEAVLRRRTQNCCFLFENPSNPSNVWACLRTMDSFGIQNVHIVMEPSSHAQKRVVTRNKKGSPVKAAMGSAGWLTMCPYSSTQEALAALRKQNYRIIAVSAVDNNLNTDDDDDDDSLVQDIRSIDWKQRPPPLGDDNNNNNNNNSHSKICIVMGNEQRGISTEIREAADVLFTLPMEGFAESFNLSVATAITCANLAAKLKEGPIRPGDLDDHELQCLKLKWTIDTLTKNNMGRNILQRNGIELPSITFLNLAYIPSKFSSTVYTYATNDN